MSTYTQAIDSVPVAFSAVDTLSISEVINGRTTLQASIISEDGSYRPQARKDIVFTEDAVTIFGGRVTNPVEKTLGKVGGDGIKTDLTATDFNALAEQVIVNLSIPAGPLGDAIEAIGAELAFFGITVSTGAGPDIEALTCSYISAKAALDLAVKAAQAAVPGTVWNIDFDKVLSAYDAATLAAPFDLDDSDSPKNYVGDIVVEPKLSTAINGVYLRAGQGQKEVIEERHDGDGSTQTFLLRVPVASLYGPTSVGIVHVVDGGTVDYPTGVYGVDDMPWTFDAATNSLVQRASETPISGTGYLTFNYVGQFPILVTAFDAVDRAANGPSDIAPTEPDVFDPAQAQAIADGYLAGGVSIAKEVRYTTRRTGIHPGMTQTIAIAQRNLSGSFLITEVVTRKVGTELWREVTATSSAVFQGSFRDFWAPGASVASGGGVPTTTGGGGGAAASQSGQLIGRQIITATGAYTYTPTPGTRFIDIELVGGGGGGAGVGTPAASQGRIGVGGGGAGYGRVRLDADFDGATGVVGAGGAGGAAGNNNGSDGADTTFITTAGSPVTYTAQKGIGGTSTGSFAPPIASFGVAGGATSGAFDLSIPGSASLAGYLLSTSQAVGGGGGQSHLAFVNMPVNAGGANSSAAGNNAQGYGGGGSGAIALGSGASTRAGGNGSNGLVIIWEYR